MGVLFPKRLPRNKRTDKVQPDKHKKKNHQVEIPNRPKPILPKKEPKP